MKLGNCVRVPFLSSSLSDSCKKLFGLCRTWKKNLTFLSKREIQTVIVPLQTAPTHINPDTHNVLWWPAPGRSCLVQSRFRRRTHIGRAPHRTFLHRVWTGLDYLQSAWFALNSSTKIAPSPKIDASSACTGEREESEENESVKDHFWWIMAKADYLNAYLGNSGAKYQLREHKVQSYHKHMALLWGPFWSILCVREYNSPPWWTHWL